MASAAPFRLPPPSGGRVDLLVVAGEHSGDAHAARAVSALRARSPGIAVAALGGPALAAAGAELLYDLTASSVVGLVEVLKNLPFFRALYAETLRWIAEHSPRAVCFVDYPGLNLRLANELRIRGVSVKGGGQTKTLYYISPQIWAWKQNRRFTMARDLDAIAVIFPFEVKCYADTTLPAEFVGHPFVAPDYVLPVRSDPAGPVLLLPGSRRQSVARIFPALLAGYRAFGERPAVVLYPSEEIARELRGQLAGAADVTLRPVESTDGAAPLAASAVLTSSGTMSMQCALAGIPGAIAYRANPLTYLMGRRLVKVPYIGIANLLLNEPMYPEYIQGAANPPGPGGRIARRGARRRPEGAHGGAGGAIARGIGPAGRRHGGRLAAPPIGRTAPPRDSLNSGGLGGIGCYITLRSMYSRQPTLADRLRFGRLLPILVAAVGLLLSFGTWKEVRNEVHRSESIRFDRLTDSAVAAIRSRFEGAERTLRGAAALVQLNPNPTRSVWSTYYHDAGPIVRQGLIGLGYAERIARGTNPRTGGLAQGGRPARIQGRGRGQASGALRGHADRAGSHERGESPWCGCRPGTRRRRRRIGRWKPGTWP